MEPDRGPGTAPRGTGSRRPPRAWSPAGKTETHGEVTGTAAERGQGWHTGSGGGRSSQVHLGTRAAGSGDRRRCPRDGRVGREHPARQSGVRPPGSRALRAASPASSWPGPAETPRFSACLSSFLLCFLHIATSEGEGAFLAPGKRAPGGSIGQYLDARGAQIPFSGRPGARAPQNEAVTRKRRSGTWSGGADGRPGASSEERGPRKGPARPKAWRTGQRPRRRSAAHEGGRADRRRRSAPWRLHAELRRGRTPERWWPPGQAWGPATRIAQPAAGPPGAAAASLARTSRTPTARVGPALRLARWRQSMAVG